MKASEPHRKSRVQEATQDKVSTVTPCGEKGLLRWSPNHTSESFVRMSSIKPMCGGGLCNWERKQVSGTRWADTQNFVYPRRGRQGEGRGPRCMSMCL